MALPVIHLDRPQQAAFTGWSGEAINYAGLPIATSVDGQFWMVLNPSGSRFTFNYKASGLYLSESGAWRKVNNAQLLLNDNQFSVYNSVDNTKQITFDASVIATSTKRVYTWPNKDGVVAMVSDINSPIIGGALVLNGVVTPTTLAANTNNWNIPTLSTKNVIYASASVNVDLTGINSTGIANGQTFFFYNKGTVGIIKLKNNNAGSLAENRIITNGDVQIKPGMGVIFSYDTTALRWRVNYFK